MNAGAGEGINLRNILRKIKCETINKNFIENNPKKIISTERIKPVAEIKEISLDKIDLMKDEKYKKGVQFIKAANSNECLICKNKISSLDKFICSYCGKPFCIKCHLPETHHCEGNPFPPD